MGNTEPVHSLVGNKCRIRLVISYGENY